jgi:glycosyltransferase involved in cell wall biosynthesis
VGRLVERKGADDFIRAFGALVNEIPDVELDIVGDGGEMSRLKELAKKLRVAERVHFFGTLTGTGFA